jgi:hypothetical protein
MGSEFVAWATYVHGARLSPLPTYIHGAWGTVTRAWDSSVLKDSKPRKSKSPTTILPDLTATEPGRHRRSWTRGRVRSTRTPNPKFPNRRRTSPPPLVSRACTAAGSGLDRSRTPCCFWPFPLRRPGSTRGRRHGPPAPHQDRLAKRGGPARSISASHTSSPHQLARWRLIAGQSGRASERFPLSPGAPRRGVAGDEIQLGTACTGPRCCPVRFLPFMKVHGCGFRFV